MLDLIRNTHIITYEHVMLAGSLASEMALYYERKEMNTKMTMMAIGDHYVTHGDVPTLLKVEGLAPEDLLETIKEVLNEERKS